VSIFIAGERILKLEYEFFKEEFEEIFGTPPDLETRRFVQDLGEYKLLLIKSRDVPRLVNTNKRVIAGITGKDWYCEYLLSDPQINSRINKRNMREMCNEYKSATTTYTDLILVKDYLTIARAKICSFIKEDFTTSPSVCKSVVTCYPKITEKWFNGEKELIVVSGETEGWVAAGFADMGVDSVATGKTLKRNSLKILDEILNTNAIVVSNKRNYDKVKKLWKTKI